MEKQLIVDVLPFVIKPQMIAESLANNNGRLIVSGPLQRADSENQNHRIYPKRILEREVGKYMKMVKERRALGELDHPDSSIINLQNASHLLTELHWEGNDVVGTIEILSTPAGNILKELFKCGVLIGISSRGLGSTKELGGDRVEVGDDYEILCWDMVSNPSTQGSFVRPMTESVDKTIVKRVVDNRYGKINTLTRDILSYLNN